MKKIKNVNRDEMSPALLAKMKALKKQFEENKDRARERFPLLCALTEQMFIEHEDGSISKHTIKDLQDEVDRIQKEEL